MKKKKIIFYSLMFLPLIVVLIALHFLPERIPAHYDFNNQVTRWGSKYETLIFPVITVLFGYFMLGMAKFSSKQEENGSNNENVCIFRKNCASVPEERSAIPLQTEQSSAG